MVIDFKKTESRSDQEDLKQKVFADMTGVGVYFNRLAMWANDCQVLEAQAKKDSDDRFRKSSKRHYDPFLECKSEEEFIAVYMARKIKRHDTKAVEDS
jgi:hypothetical protein